VISDHVASGAYASRMLTGAFTAARACNHLLVIGETEGDPDVEGRLIGEMLDRQVDGILYATLATSEVPVPPLLADHRLVMLNCLDVSLTRSSKYLRTGAVVVPSKIRDAPLQLF